MKRTGFVIIVNLLLFSLESVAIEVDSSLNSLSIHFGKRKLNCYDEFYEKPGPFSDNYIISSSILLNRKIYKTKSYNIYGSMGMNFRILECGYRKSTAVIESITEDFSSGTFMIGLQYGVSVERRVLTLKNHLLDLGIGYAGSGIIFNSSKTISRAYNQTSSFGKDSIVLNFKPNRLFYLNPFVRLSIKSKIGNKKLNYGVQYLMGTVFDQTNISYAVYDTRLPGYYRYKGKFIDNNNQVEVFLGFSF